MLSRSLRYVDVFAGVAYCFALQFTDKDGRLVGLSSSLIAYCLYLVRLRDGLVFCVLCFHCVFTVFLLCLHCVSTVFTASLLCLHCVLTVRLLCLHCVLTVSLLILV